MIPRRVQVKGFLCYRDEQEVCFDGGSLWMLAGPNGSGKSAVFDAVTYALFGQHRGGRQNARELINKDADGLVVEFDFFLDGQLYQARRTLKKKSTRSTRQVSRWQADAAGDAGSWQAVADTNSEAGFTEWVREHIGLSFETFTSSVLLLQGKAEKLLAAEPAERFKVLASIVDLGRYQRLFDRADARRRDAEVNARGLQQQLDALREVSAEELEEIGRRIAGAEVVKDTAQAAVEKLQRLEMLAERWADLQEKLKHTQERWEHAEGLFEQAETIEAKWESLGELRRVLPHLETVVRQRARVAEAHEAVSRLEAERREIADRLAGQDDRLAKARQDRDACRREIEADEKHEQTAGNRLRELAGLLGRLELCEKHRLELTRLEAERARLPGGLPDLLTRQQQEHDRLLIVHQNLPLLRRLHASRQGLGQALERSQQAVEREKAVVAQAGPLTEALAELTRQAEVASQAYQQARERATEARTLLREVADQVDQFREFAGAQTCRHCGQPLTPGHYGAELARRERERQTAEARSRQAEEASQALACEEQHVLNRKKELEEQLQGLRDQVRESRHHREQADRDAGHQDQECATAYRDLAESFQQLVVGQASSLPPSNGRQDACPTGWLATTYPTAGDLDDARRQLAGREAVCQRLRELRAAHEEWTGLDARAETARAAVRALEANLSGDVSALRREHFALEDEHKAIKARLQLLRARVKAAQEFLDQLARERQTLAKRLADQDIKLNEQQVHRANARDAAEQAGSFLPPAWQAGPETLTAADLQVLANERRGLEEAGIEAQIRNLQQARAGWEALRQRKAHLEEEQAGIPAEGRCDPAQVRGLVAEAKGALAARETELSRARQAHFELTKRQEQRQQLADQFRGADRRQTLYRTLVDHLGRKGLQLHLVRQAERGIIDFANLVLDRLSGGRFCLRLGGGEDSGDDQALQLEAYDRSCGQAFGLPFLSGSQRFRVAVSLALGVGRYASRQHRPIESVIIDEGFGCLDREGRQVMIQELQNLRTQLRCVLLVSHQEEFAEAFADGYRFELKGGTTEVTRFQR